MPCRPDVHWQSKMSIIVEMRSNKLGSMDIDQLRGWATFMDRAMIASLVATVLAVTALGVTTWLSFRYNNAVRTQEHATFDRVKDIETRSGQLEKDAAAARERSTALEQQMAAARDRAATAEQEATAARERAASLEQAARDANERADRSARAARAARDTAIASAKAAAREKAAATEKATATEKAAADEKAAPPPLDIATIQQRVAELAKLVRDATARSAETSSPAPGQAEEKGTSTAATESASAAADKQSPVVASLRKYAGAKAAIFMLAQVSEAPAAAAAISTDLGDAGWAAQSWTWQGVAGIYGVVVLLKDGSDAATTEAAAALVEALRTAGFNATKGDWPADWRRYRGTLDGPQTPAPAEAPIRIVVGSKPR